MVDIFPLPFAMLLFYLQNGLVLHSCPLSVFIRVQTSYYFTSQVALPFTLRSGVLNLNFTLCKWGNISVRLGSQPPNEGWNQIQPNPFTLHTLQNTNISKVIDSQMTLPIPSMLKLWKMFKSNFKSAYRRQTYLSLSFIFIN